jgi:hypothetical protein
MKPVPTWVQIILAPITIPLVCLMVLAFIAWDIICDLSRSERR